MRVVNTPSAELLDICREAYHVFQPHQSYSEEAVINFIKHPDTFVLIHEDDGIVGVLMAVVSKPAFSDDLTAIETLWYSRDQKVALALLRGYKRWAEGIGCRYIQYSHPTGCKSFDRKYTKINVDYIEEIV